MTTSYDTDQNTQAAQTVAAAWASSPLGEPDHEVGFADETVAGFGDETVAAEAVAEESTPAAKHAIVALALAGGIGAGAAIALMFVDFTPDQPIVVPGTSPDHAVVVTEGSQPAANDKVAERAPTTVAPAPAHKPAPAAVNTPPPSAVGGPSEVVDVPVSDPSPQQEEPAVDEPADPDPEPPGPQDPNPWVPGDLDFSPNPPDPGPADPNPWVPGDLDFTNPEPPIPPDPGPKFEPPIVLPPLQPEPPSKPDLDIKAGS